MMKDVVISLHSTQNTGTDEEDTIDFSTDGMYTYDGENACITYLESEVTGLTGTRTSVIVTPDKVAVERDGFITSRMFFMEGEKTSFLYDTPAGSATLSVRARSIKKTSMKTAARWSLTMCSIWSMQSSAETSSAWI